MFVLPYLNVTMYGTSVSLNLTPSEAAVTAPGPEVLLLPLEGMEMVIVLEYITHPYLYRSIVESKIGN